MTLKEFVEHRYFSGAILAVIIFNAALIGAGTYVTYPIFKTLEWICVWIFVVEIVLKFITRDSSRAFFRDGWNIFDIIIISSAFVPNMAQFSTVLRILRVFRVMRLVRTMPELRVIVTVLVRSLSAMLYIGLLMLVCTYIYAVIGVELFGKNQPEYATLHETFFTLFRLLTADDWTQLRYEALIGSSDLEPTMRNVPMHNRFGWEWFKINAFYVSWVIVSMYLMINLVIGAIMNNYQAVEQEEKLRKGKTDLAETRMLELVDELSAMIKDRVHQLEKNGGKSS